MICNIGSVRPWFFSLFFSFFLSWRVFFYAGKKKFTICNGKFSCRCDGKSYHLQKLEILKEYLSYLNMIFSASYLTIWIFFASVEKIPLCCFDVWHFDIFFLFPSFHWFIFYPFWVGQKWSCPKGGPGMPFWENIWIRGLLQSLGFLARTLGQIVSIMFLILGEHTTTKGICF